MKKISNKYIIYIGTVIGIMTVFLLTFSYAYYQKVQTQGGTNTFKVLTCLDLSFTSNTDAISLTNTYPLSDVEGLGLKPYNFTLKNNCSTYVEYYLLVSEITVSDQLNSGYIKMSLDGHINNGPKLITQLEPYATPSEISGVTNSYVLGESSLAANQSQTMNFRMWLDGENENIWSSEDIENKNYSVKISIVGIAKNPVD